MELIFLGTGAGLPSKQRNVSSCVFNVSNNRSVLWLFDCGEGTQQRFMHLGLRSSKVERVFISHLHGDHFFGLPGLLSTRSFSGLLNPITIYGPVGIRALLTHILQLTKTYIPYPITIEEISEGVLFEDDFFKVETALLAHRIDSYGFRVTEKDRPRNLDAEALKAAGVEPGPIFQKLKQGEKVQLENGQIIDGSDYLRPVRKGKVVTILGDTKPCKASIQLANKADVLVHEATLEAALAEQAASHGHSTTAQAAQIAKDSRAKRLIINHISSRYCNKDNQRLLEECQAIFPQTEMATDFAVFDV